MEEINEFSNQFELTPELKAYVIELMSQLKNDKEVYESLKKYELTTKEVRENISKLTDYKNDFHYCKKCPGLKNCKKENACLNYRILRDNGKLIFVQEACPKKVEDLKFESNFIYKDFPNEWNDSTLKALDRTENRKLLIAEFLNILKGKTSKWLYIKGNSKTGKSFVAATIACEFVRKNLGMAAFIEATTKFGLLATYSRKYEEDFNEDMAKLTTVPLLVIDDIGAEYKNEYIRDTVVLPLLSERSRNKVTTIFTSQFTIKELQTLYSVGQNGGEIRGKQLANLLKDMCETEFDLTGASIYK